MRSIKLRCCLSEVNWSFVTVENFLLFHIWNYAQLPIRRTPLGQALNDCPCQRDVHLIEMDIGIYGVKKGGDQLRLDKVPTPDLWFLTVQTQCCMVRLRTSHFPLLTSHFPLLTFDFRFPTSGFQLPTSNFRFPSWLLFQARSATRVLILKVKAQ